MGCSEVSFFFSVYPQMALCPVNEPAEESEVSRLFLDTSWSNCLCSNTSCPIAWFNFFFFFFTSFLFFTTLLEPLGFQLPSEVLTFEFLPHLLFSREIKLKFDIAILAVKKKKLVLCFKKERIQRFWKRQEEILLEEENLCAASFMYLSLGISHIPQRIKRLSTVNR